MNEPSGGRAPSPRPIAEPSREVSGGRSSLPTAAGREVQELYSAADVHHVDYARELGDPGTFPFTRGLHPQGYRTRLWTMRQFAGFGSPEATNDRYKRLLATGGTGLSVAFDLPTLMGRDPDHPLAAGEVGRCGVSVASLDDMERLFDGIALDEVTTSMTINSPAPMLFAMYLALAERRRVPWARLAGTIQNDILKEYIAEKEFIFPPRPSMRLATDLIAFATTQTPRWNPISISGYHIREAGSTAAQELAFTIRDGIEYVEWCVGRGLAVDDFAPRLSFFFNAGSDLFEEIAKFRAARRLWARVMRDRFQARQEASWRLRFHAQTAGASLTAQQPYNNVSRTTWQALAAVLGGANSLHTNSLDEAFGLPTEEAATVALRTQQVLAYESGVANVVDPFGGSYFLETLTADLEREAMHYIERIDAMGGMVPAIERGFPQQEIADAAYRDQQALERGARTVVGVNAFVDGQDAVSVMEVDAATSRMQVDRLAGVRARRDEARVRRALADLSQAAVGEENTMEPLLEVARAYGTVGEMCDALRAVWGEYVEPSRI